MKNTEVYTIERRREEVRESSLNGLDYVEVVSDDQCTLQVYFLGKAPEKAIEEVNVRIEGGRRITRIHVIDVDLHRDDDPERDDYMTVTVDTPGDFSTYTLRLVELDGHDHGHPKHRRFPGFDARYDHVEFSFKAGCASDLDCKTDGNCAPVVYETPQINYLAKDYASFRQLILDRLAITIPGWQERHVPDIGIALVEVLAYAGDYLSYYQDAVATEAYLDTARQRVSVRRHARLVDYAIHEGCNARTWLFVQVSDDITATTTPGIKAQDIYFITGYNDALDTSDAMLNDYVVQQFPVDSYEVFEPVTDSADQPLGLYKAHDEIRFYTWGDQDCCLPRGAISATLQDYEHGTDPDEDESAYLEEEVEESEDEEEDEEDEPQIGQERQEKQPSTPKPAKERVLRLKKGDYLFFEEVRGAKTGLPEDALATHRHIVRLTNVQPAKDHLYDNNVLDIEWAAEDALPFPLCISGMGRAPECKQLQNISIARGNMLLVDHGRTVKPAGDQETVEADDPLIYCEGEGEPADVTIRAKAFHPVLSMAPLTFSQPLRANTPATQLLTQNPRQAVPQITLTSTLPPEQTPPGENCDAPIAWFARPDLLESSGEERDYVVEMDNDGYAHLRFGDNELGRAPEANESFTCVYRIGNGPAGNVGPESISRIVFRNNDKPDGVTLVPRNPFAAAGGTLPEPLAEVKLFAPRAFRDELERAITADDYAKLAQMHPSVQRAAASLRWTGSGYDVLVVIDPLGTEVLSPGLRKTIEQHLEQYRRIGYDVLVEQAEYVPLDIAMTVCVQPHQLRGHVKADLLKRFSNGVLSDGTLGFFHPDNQTFGDSIAASKLIALAQAVPGVMSVSIDKLERFGEGPNQELHNGILPISPLEIAQLDNDPSFPEHGKLTFTMKGGR